MNKIAKTAMVLGTLLASLAGAAYWQRSAIGMHLMEGEVQRRAADADPIGKLPDGLHVGMCGTGAPLPDPRRGGPCTVVVAGTRMFLFDAGASSARSITLMGLSLGQLDAAFLTHYHSDHIDGLGEVLLQHWAQKSAQRPLPVYGPAGLEPVVEGFHRSYAHDRGYRIAHHGTQTLPPDGFGATPHAFELQGPERRRVLIDEPDLQIVAFAVEHAPVDNAVGYRIRYKDRSMVLSGDTSRSAAVLREAKGVDLLMHEAVSPEMVRMFERNLHRAGRIGVAHVMSDLLSYHTSPEDAAAIAQQAGVRTLVLHHILPMLPTALEASFLNGAQKIYSGPLHIAVDRDWVSMPAGGNAINYGRRE